VSLHPPAEEDRVSRFASRRMGWLLKVCTHCCTQEKYRTKWRFIRITETQTTE
jgi:hypothetical protein